MLPGVDLPEVIRRHLKGMRNLQEGRHGLVSAQVSGEEAQRVLRLEDRDVAVLAGVGMQRLPRGAKRRTAPSPPAT